MTYFDPVFVLKTATLPEPFRTQLRAAVHLHPAHTRYDTGLKTDRQQFIAGVPHLADARDIFLVTAPREGLGTTQPPI